MENKEDSEEHCDYDYYVILDFEATCDSPKKLYPMEIIEFPAVIVEAKSNQVIAEFQRYVKPIVHPKLTKFCTRLTGIRQETVDKGITLQEATKEFNKWLAENGCIGRNFDIITVGNWDLGIIFPEQCEFHKIKPASHLRRWVNIKEEFGIFYNCRKPGGMVKMLRHLAIKLEGRHHSGIDDCRNTAKIWMRMIKDGYKLDRQMVNHLY
jgi:inhibitor of KinA sporulation pathway (predicted exonuclease)